MKEVFIKICNINLNLLIIKDQNNKIIYRGKTREIHLKLKYKNIYKVYLYDLHSKYLIPIFINRSTFIISLNKTYKKTFILTDYFYKNLPITKGVIILNAT